MSVRIEVFSAVSIDPAPERAFLAVLQTIGKNSINMNFYGASAKGSRCSAEAWLTAEQERLAEIERASEARAAARKKEKEPAL